jgi:hypothetical protein
MGYFLVLTLDVEDQLTHYEKPVNWLTNKNA